jgi:cell division protease FtsH
MTPHPDGQQVPVPTEEERRGLPAPGYHGAGSGAEAETRKPLAWWDRIKFLLLFFLLFWFFVWSDLSDDNPFNTLGDAVQNTLRTKWPLFVVIGIELLRQVHYLVAERSPRYYGFWNRMFERWERRTRLVNDWNRYRIARVIKVLVVLGVASVILAAIYDVTPITALFELPSRVWGWLPTVFQLLFAMVFLIGQFAALFWFLSRGGVDTYMPDEIKTRFSDVWGQDAVLARVKENMVFLDRPEAIEDKGGYVPGGLLLWGPPGTGKTLMAEAVAGETGKPFVFVDPGAFTNMFMGVGILKVKGLFRKLRKLALRYGGVIVFFDEADALGNRGQLTPGPFGQPGATPAPDSPWSVDGSEHLRWLSPQSQAAVLQSALAPASVDERAPRVVDRIIMGGMGGGGGMGTLQALLSEMSGLKKPRGFINRIVRRTLGMRPKPPPKYRILVMMATNMPQSLDEALLRPGRIDRMYKVGYPSKEGRMRTYEGYLAKVSNDLTPADIDKLATITPYATGASMKDLVNEALIYSIREGREAITWEDVIKAKHLKELGPPEDVEYIERERHAIAIHEACHAVAAYRSRKHLMIDLATIEKGGSYLGMVSSIKPEDQFTRWRSEYESDIVVSLASLAGERMFFDGDSSSGVSGDLESATTVATLMEGYWGMGEMVASHGVTHRVGIGGGGRPGGAGDDDQRDLLKSNLGERIDANLGQLLERADVLLREHRTQVLVLAHALETHKTIAGEDVIAVLDGTEGPLIDGRAYHEPGFVAELETYHAAVSEAHKRHEKVAMPLPKTNGQTPEAEQEQPEPVEVGSNGPAGQASPNGGRVPLPGQSFT